MAQDASSVRKYAFQPLFCTISAIGTPAAEAPRYDTHLRHADEPVTECYLDAILAVQKQGYNLTSAMLPCITEVPS